MSDKQDVKQTERLNETDEVTDRELDTMSGGGAEPHLVNPGPCAPAQITNAQNLPLLKVREAANKPLLGQ